MKKMINNQTQKSASIGWQVKKLGDVASLLKDGSHGTHVDVIDGVPLLSAKDLKRGRVEIDNNPRLIAIEDFNQIHKNYKIKNGDILVSLVGSIGKIALVKNYHDNYTLQRSVGILRFEKDNNLFLYHFFNTKYFQNQLLVKENKGAQGGVYLGSLSKIKLNLPSLPEQNRIVAVLETWDKAIKKLTKKIEFKKNIKKGLMQRLLTGELRLTGFSKPWDFIKLKNICAIQKGKQLNKSAMVPDGTFPALNGGVEASGRTNKWNADKDTITISEGGNSCGYVNFNKEKFWCGGHCYLVIPSKGFDNLFLYQALKLRQTSIMMMRVGSGLPNIQKKSLDDFKILISIDKEEQKAISKVLATADKEIEMYEQKLKLLKTQKNYLLNNLITGAIRTPETMKIKS